MELSIYPDGTEREELVEEGRRIVLALINLESI